MEVSSLFLYDTHDLDTHIPGGVQLCSREFFEVVKAFSEVVHLCSVEKCRRLYWRIRRRLHFGAYLLYHPEEARLVLCRKIQQNTFTHIFVNRSELLRLTPILRELSPLSQLILMSHGNQSGDDLYELAGQEGRRNHGISKLAAYWQIGQDLGVESWFRHRYIDVVCVMSKEEEVLERWLGAKKTVVLPRVIVKETLPWNPVPKRIGYVGTLDHTPNRVALEQICLEFSRFQSTNIELRLIGNPISFGQNLAMRFKFVKYLGALDDLALKKEVSTWSLFLNPIFWLSRGASMKLGKALSWGIPFLTTFSGARGYELKNANNLIAPDNASEFTRKVMELINNHTSLVEAKKMVELNRLNSPSIIDLAARLSLAIKR